MANYTLLDGVTSDGILLGPGDRMLVSSGGTATGTTVNSDGYLTISNGGVASHTTINDDGYCYVLSGGVVNSAIVNSNGLLYIEESGTVNNAVVFSGASLYIGYYIGGGGTANDVTIASGADITFYVNSRTTSITGTCAGSAFDVRNGYITLHELSNGYISVKYGCVASDMIITREGSHDFGVLNVHGIVDNIHVKQYGQLDLYSGCTATNFVVSSGGRLAIAVSPDTYISGMLSGSAIETKSGIISDLVIDAYLSIWSGGTATNITQNEYFYIHDGGIADGTIANGVVIVSSGGAAFNTDVKRHLDIYRNGVAETVSIDSKGTVLIYEGGKLTGWITAKKGAVISASSGGIIDFDLTQASPGGTAILNDMSIIRGIPNYTLTIDGTQAYGKYSLAEGASDFDGVIRVTGTSGELFGLLTLGNTLSISGFDYTLVLSQGVLSLQIDPGGTMPPSSEELPSVTSGGVVVSGCIMEALPGTRYENPTVDSWGSLFIHSSGTATNATVNYWGSLFINNGGTADSATVNSNGELFVSRGGTATNTTVNSGGLIFVSSGGTATGIKAAYRSYIGFAVAPDTYVQGKSDGSAFEMKDASISDYSVGAYGSLCIFSGGTAENISVITYGELIVCSGGVVKNAIDVNGEIFVSSGGTINGVTINYGTIRVSSGGTAINIDAGSGDVLFVVAPDTYVQGTSDGRAFEMKDAYISGYAVSANSLEVFSGGTAEDMTVNRHGKIIVSRGGSALQVKENGGVVFVEEGGSVTFASNTFYDITLSHYRRGSATVHSGTTAVNTLVSEGGALHVFDGGVVSGTVVEKILNTYYPERGLHVFSGGMASGTTVRSDGEVRVSSGGTADGSIINEAGYLWVEGGGKANGTTVNTSGHLVIRDSGAADNTVVNPDGELYQRGSGTVSNTTVFGNGRFFLVEGMADSTTVSSGGSFIVSGGGTALHTDVSSGGTAIITDARSFSGTVHGGGIITGRFDCKGITFASGAILDIGIAGLDPGADALIGNLSLANGAIFTLTVSDAQADGVYSLADGAAGFDKTISVVDASGDSIGTLKVGETAKINGKDYTLNLDSGTLALTLDESGVTPPDDPGITVEDKDILLPEAMPQAEYMYGCTPTAVGMLLGYYDLYGYNGMRFSNMIEGDVDLYSRGTDGDAYNMNEFDTALGKAIATEDYVYRFVSRDGVETTPAQELEYAFRSDGSLNSGVWDCIADYLGTGQYWRGNDNLSTTTTIGSLKDLYAYPYRDVTISDGTVSHAIQYKETGMLYGLDLYLQSRGYRLDTAATGTYTVDVNGGQFTFADYKAEIDAGRPVIISIESHSMVGYGYNEATKEIIFDDCYRADQRMVWDGVYHYADADRKLQSITVIALDESTADAGPKKPVVSAEATDATGMTVAVTAEFGEDSTVREYSLDGTTWQAYTGAIMFTENGSVYFRGADAAGNYSLIARYDVSSLDPDTIPEGANVVSGRKNSSVSSEKDVYLKKGASIYSVYPGALQLIGDGLTVTLAGENTLSCSSIRNADILFGHDAYWTDEDTGPHYDGTVNFNGENISFYSSVSNCITAAGIVGNNLTVSFNGAASGSKNISFESTNPTSGPGNFAGAIMADGDLVINGTFGGDVNSHFDFSAIADNYRRQGTIFGFYAGGNLTVNGSISGDLFMSALSTLNSYSYGLRAADGDLTVTGTISGIIATTSDYFARAISGNKVNVTVSGTLFAGKSTAENDMATLLNKLRNWDTYKEELLGLVDSKYFAVSVYDTSRIAFQGNALIVGNLGLQYSSDSVITISDAASIYGDVMTNYTGNSFVLKLNDASLNGTRIVSSSWNTRLSILIDADGITSNGSYSLMETTDGTVPQSVVLSIAGQEKTLSLGKSVKVGDVEYALAKTASGSGETMTLTVSGLDESAEKVISFDLTKTTPGAPALVKDLSSVTGVLLFTLTIAGTEINGTYNLAGGAAGFDKTITVMNTSGTKLGTLTVGGTFSTENKDYKLMLAGDALTLDVAAKAVPDTTLPVVSNVKADITAPTNRDVTVTADFTDDVAVASKQYKLGEDGTWTDYFGGVTVTENITVFFKAVDSSDNESEVVSITVDNIDKVPPAKPSASADVTEATTARVNVSAVFSEDSVKQEYSLDNGKTWQDYTAAIVFTANGTVLFRGTDAAGNTSEVVSYAVTNIDSASGQDQVKPTVSNIVASITAPTNQDVIVTADFTDDVELASSLYKIGEDGVWTAYPEGGVTVTENATVYFKAIDTAGNESELASITVDNIDKVPPAKPTATADVIQPTNGEVSVTAVFSDDSAVREYSFDGLSWAQYPGVVRFSANGTVYFRAADALGNVSEVGSYAVTNIDKVPPAKPTAFADITASTGGKVTVTAVFSEDSARKEYSLDGLVWSAYTDPVVFSANGTVYFRAADAAGNMSDIISYAVTNITGIELDTTPPTITVTPSTTAPAEFVTVTAVFTDDVGVATRKYRIGDDVWMDYSGPVTVTENTLISFLAVDTSGNTKNADYVVTNIQAAVSQNNKPDDGWNDYLYDKKKGWNTKLDDFVVNVVEGNGRINLDNVGSISQDSMLNMFGNDGINIDAGDAAKIVVLENAKLSFKITSTADSTFYIYEDGKDKKGNRKQLTVGKVAVKAGEKAALEDVCLTVAGRYYAVMAAKNVKAIGTEGFYNVSVSACMFFHDADDGWNNAATNVGVKDNPQFIERGAESIVLDNNAITDNSVFDNYVGVGDTIDYARLELDTSAYLSFTLKTHGAAKLTLWKQNAKGKLTKVCSVSSLGFWHNGEAQSKAQSLDPIKYTYYISVESLDAAKGGYAYYNVFVTPIYSRFFDSADNGENNWLYDKKSKTYNDDANLVENVVTGDQVIILDENPSQDSRYQNYVGYGDATDYAKVILTSKGMLRFEISTLAEVTFEIWQKGKDKKGNNVLKSIGKKTTIKLKSRDYDTGTMASTAGLSLDAGEYYISVTAKKTTANEKGNAFYRVKAEFTPAVNDAQLESAVAAAGYTTGLESPQDDKSAWQSLATLA